MGIHPNEMKKRKKNDVRLCKGCELGRIAFKQIIADRDELKNLTTLLYMDIDALESRIRKYESQEVSETGRPIGSYHGHPAPNVVGAG